MAINLKKNEKALLDAYNDVLNAKTDTNWAVFTYEGKTNDLKVSETGDGDIEEMVDELSGGKMMYVFMRVKDPNTQLYKNVLVNWSGEGVPAARKGVCARHTQDVARFFRGAHVTINARSEMDLEEATILDKVAKASGANFSIHKEKARPMPEAGPVGSVYKKADARRDINETRDQFWSKQEKEEENRKASEKRTAAETRRKEEQERRARDAEEAREREKREKTRFQSIDQQKREQQVAMKREQEEKEAELQARLARREKEVDTDLEREKKAREQQRVREHSSIAPGVRDKKSAFERPAQPAAKPAARPPPKRMAAPPRQPEPEPEPEPEPDYEQEGYDEPEPDQPLYDDIQQEEDYPEEPDQPLYDDVKEEEPAVEQPTYDDIEGAMEETEEAIYDDAVDVAGGDEGGLTAKTVYDYQAEDENEISFDVDEIITDIEQLDPGWWRGTRQLDGSNGLFPANYVELI